MVCQQPPTLARPLDGDIISEDVRREDDEVLRQLYSTHG